MMMMMITMNMFLAVHCHVMSCHSRVSNSLIAGQMYVATHEDGCV
jgi:hypothetical protein